MKIEHAKTKEQLEKIKKLYIKAFPLCERKPFSMMLKKRSEKMMEIMCIEEDDGTFVGLAITVLYNDIVLLDYFAILDEQRCNGKGSQALKILTERYKDKRFFLEAESTKEECKDIAVRKRRKEFYLRNGMTETGIDVVLFGVPMELLTYNCMVSFEEYHTVYDKVFGKIISNNVKVALKSQR